MDNASLIRPMLITSSIIFALEAATMTALWFLSFELNVTEEIILNSIILAGLSAPLIYGLAVKPYADKKRSLIKDLEVAQADLLKINDELRFQQFALNEHAIVSITDVQGSITYANDKFCEISGYSREELLGQNHRMLSSGAHSRAFFVDLWATITSGKTWQGEIENMTKDGSSYWLSATIVPFLNEKGKPFRYVAIRRDITNQKKISNELVIRTNGEQEARLQAEKASKAKSEFLASMSHDLRTPLNAIIGFSDIMKAESFGPLGSNKYKEYAGDINDSGNLLLNMINDVLDIAKVEAGKYELRDEPLDVQNVIGPSIKQLSLMAQTTDQTISIDIAPDIPCLLGDGRVLIQMLNNLLSNAIKFTPKGGNITVTGALDIATDRIFISVKDTGVGMSAKDIAKALEPFEQINSYHSRQHKGTGLGLHLCANFMELFGGDFILESEEGTGTKASLYFPRERTIST